MFDYRWRSPREIAEFLLDILTFFTAIALYLAPWAFLMEVAIAVFMLWVWLAA